jgi:hypothetical protein
MCVSRTITNDEVGARAEAEAEVKVQLQVATVIKDGDLAFQMRREVAAEARVGLDAVGVPTAAHGRLRETEASPCNEISSLGHHAKVYQDQRRGRGRVAMPLQPLTRHIPTPARPPPRRSLWRLCVT